jgi:hypothetical protein
MAAPDLADDLRVGQAIEYLAIKRPVARGALKLSQYPFAGIDVCGPTEPLGIHCWLLLITRKRLA